MNTEALRHAHCALCGEDPKSSCDDNVVLAARCHPGAGVGLAVIDGNLIALRCYHCGELVAVLTAPQKVSTAGLPLHQCDNVLCPANECAVSVEDLKVIEQKCHSHSSLLVEYVRGKQALSLKCHVCRDVLGSIVLPTTAN